MFCVGNLLRITCKEEEIRTRLNFSGGTQEFV
jgi:hypothetical protein